MTSTEIIAIVGAVVSFGSMVAAILSAGSARKNAKIAEEATNQARQTALLGPRSEAINHLHDAIDAIKTANAITPELVESIRKAKNIADRVCNKKTQDDLNSYLELAHLTIGITSLNALTKLLVGLEGLIDRMNREAQLGG